jgi:hypothetical protein
MLAREDSGPSRATREVDAAPTSRPAVALPASCASGTLTTRPERHDDPLAATLARAVRRRTQRGSLAVLARDFRIGDKKVQDAFSALQLLAPKLQDQHVGSKRLLQTILLGLHDPKGEVGEAAVWKAYAAAVDDIMRRAAAKKQANEEAATILKSKDNEQWRKLIGALTGAPNFHDRFTVVIRGMTGQQALNVAREGTFGGQTAGARDREPPSEKQAQVQTGEGVKQTDDYALEEWSLTAQTGFATGGFLVVAVIARNRARLPPPVSLAQVSAPQDLNANTSTQQSGPSRAPVRGSFSDAAPLQYGGFFGTPPPGGAPVGEAGVTGWADQPFASFQELADALGLDPPPPQVATTPLVALHSQGRELTLSSAAAFEELVSQWIKHNDATKIRALV